MDYTESTEHWEVADHMLNREKLARKKRQDEMARLQKELAHTKGAIDCALINFEHAVDPTMVDCYIYEWKAAQMRYQFLLKCVKQFEAGLEPAKTSGIRTEILSVSRRFCLVMLYHFS